MSLSEFYQVRIRQYQQKAERLQQKENRLSLARLISFVLIFVLFFSLYSLSVFVAVASAILCTATFAVLVKIYTKTEKEKDYLRHLREINMLELNSLSGDTSGFADGREYINPDHPNAYDLDLFGHASLFQFINRTVSLPGSDMLASWLLNPAGRDEIKSRQQAVEELKPEIDWRQEIMTTGYFTRHTLDHPGELLSWMRQDNEFPRIRRLKIITYSLSLLGIFFTFLVIAGNPASMLLLVLAINFLFYFSQGKKINKLHLQVSKSAGLLQTYADIVRFIEEKVFRADKLRSLQAIFKSRPAASAAIKRLSMLVSRLDARLNIMVSIPLNLFFFWDIHICLALERWKQLYGGKTDAWLKCMAEFEVLNSMANMAYNNPDWCMPEVIPGYFTFRARNFGHPLIPAGRRVANDIEIDKGGKVLIVTGSNMAGKSTFLRTCGVNTVLALAGAPVCASGLTLSHVQVYSSMRISDSLEDNTSSFYAELKRLASIIRKAEQDPQIFILLDEVLRGTNSNDRFTGSVALMKQLAGYGTVVILATHDLKLAELEKSMPGKINNYHFDVKVDGEELYFDYKLSPGICTSLNASILMKKMGIRV
jgi:ABC-type Na+ transport system ATPase subunit NatA